MKIKMIELEVTAEEITASKKTGNTLIDAFNRIVDSIGRIDDINNIDNRSEEIEEDEDDGM